MKRAVIGVLALLVTAMAALIAIQATRVPRRSMSVAAAPVEHAAAGVPGTPSELASAAADSALVSVRASSMPAPQRDLAEIQRRLADGESGTYIREILLQRGDNNTRWPERELEPLRVWVQPYSTLPNFRSSFPVRAREAFERWMRVGMPVRFTFVVDSAASDLPVTWVDRFDMPISGRTRWTHDQHWWIVSSSIQVALHHQDGRPLEPEAIYAITLHEVGHVLGLDHTQDERSIMAARVRVSELGDLDERTVRLVYSIPPGAVSAR